ncbi:probable xyloglucan galactosyltransferase GT14 [Mercurialis annua]|uniref:probable xyloglucan galactosyltransferase GT14 n=1 Tax=Mercurialis annua TaxID=3986 RepID=UPI0021603579|nr:probable xyloglucan galactosyltransferase GT14 [Mercurialis annua]
MEKPITRNFCNNQLWLVIIVSFIFCFILLCFDYSALTGSSQNGFTALVNNFENPITTQLSKSLNQTQIKSNKEDPSVQDSCLGSYIYVQEIPRRFNQELLDNCESITVGTEHNMCPYLVNYGLGSEVEDSQGILLNQSWYSTNQFLLEVIFHNRIKKYKCLTNDSSLASAVYVPFYAGLDVGRYLWGFNSSVRDKSSFDIIKWLIEKPEWERLQGRDHFLVAGRIAWDFRRKTDEESDWGSKFRVLPESHNMSMLAIESSSWNNDYAIPYPTCFHPLKDIEVIRWQDLMRARKRSYLFSFAGAPRQDLRDSVRGKIIEECQDSEKLCKLLECSYGVNGSITCDNPMNVMKLFQDSVYCLQPTGDSYTRRSIFDSILAGCIPVFFHPGTAYAQYKWHLPKNYSSYSVFIPVKDVKDWKTGINETLLRIPEDRVLAMREEVIKIIPNIIYADPRSRLEGIEDAFDLAVKGILERIERVRSVIKEGKDPSVGFADGDDFKYTFSGYVGET